MCLSPRFRPVLFSCIFLDDRWVKSVSREAMNEKEFCNINTYGTLGAENLFSPLDPVVPGAAMPGYHILSTAPCLRRRGDGIYEMSAISLLTAELSARLWRRFNGSIRLLTDPRGCEYVKSTPLADAYDEILPVLDPRCCGIDPLKYWAAGKIAALSNLPLPCVLLDMDMLIWKPLSLTGEKLVCACVEFVDETVYPPLSYFRTTGDYSFPPAWSEEASPLNTAFVYINDRELKDEYTREAFRFMLAEKETPGYWAVCITFAEQRILGMCAEARGIYAKLLTDMEPRDRIMTHIWGGKHKLETEKEYGDFYRDLCLKKLDILRREDSR